MLHTLRFSLQNAVYFIMYLFWFLYYSHFTYRMCSNLNVKLRCQKVNDPRRRSSSSFEQDGQRTYKRNIEGLRATIVAVETQQVLHILSACFQPQVSSMQCGCAMLLYVVCPAVQYFSTLSHKRHDFREKEREVIEHKMCVLILSINLSKNFSF